MRVALIVVAIAFVASPSHASPSCMTMAEARAAFPGKHLWWHGPNKCWDATPGRRQLAQRIQARESQREPQKESPGQQQKTAREAPAERAGIEERKRPNWTHESRWREAMSRMRPEDDAALQSSMPARASADALEAPPAPRVNWRDRWVEVVPRVPPAAVKPGAVELSTAAAPVVEPLLTPMRVILALLGVLLTLATVEIVFRSTIRDWRK